MGKISNGPAEEVRSVPNSSDIQSSPKQNDGVSVVKKSAQRTRRFIGQLHLPKTQEELDARARTLISPVIDRRSIAATNNAAPPE